MISAAGARRIDSRTAGRTPQTDSPVYRTQRCSLWSPYVIGQTIICSSCFMVALCNRETIYIFILFLLLSSSFFFLFFPRLISAVGDWMSTILWHMGGPSVNLECRSETCCARLAGNTGRKKSRQKSPSRHHRTTLSGHIFATKACIDNRKKTC